VRGDADVAGAFEGVFAVGRINRFGFSAHIFKITNLLGGIKQFQSPDKIDER
jgi:hypothetical protein